MQCQHFFVLFIVIVGNCKVHVTHKEVNMMTTTLRVRPVAGYIKITTVLNKAAIPIISKTNSSRNNFFIASLEMIDGSVLIVPFFKMMISNIHANKLIKCC